MIALDCFFKERKYSGVGVSSLFVLALALCTFLLASSAGFSASAEGFFAKIFGNSIVSHSYRKTRLRRPSRISTYNIRRIRNKARSIGRASRTNVRPSKKRKMYRIPNRARKVAGSGGTYRTMCVRECDGFFFPISFATGKGNLRKDAKSCKSRCGTPASLYVYRNPGSKIEDMVSLRGGKKYKKLRTAFLFKKKFVANCRCRPEPWTQAAKSRHRKYARANIDPLKALAMREGKRRYRKKRYSSKKRAGSSRRSARIRRGGTSANSQRRSYYIRSARSIGKRR